MPNFEVDDTMPTLELAVHDSPLDLQDGVTDVTKDDPKLMLEFNIINGPDLPVINHSNQFNAFTKENEPLDIYAFFKDTVDGFLEVHDEDGVDSIVWASSGFSERGGRLILTEVMIILFTTRLLNSSAQTTYKYSIMTPRISRFWEKIMLRNMLTSKSLSPTKMMIRNSGLF